MRQFIGLLIAHSVGLWLAHILLAGFIFMPGILPYMIAATSLTLIHLFLRPIVKLILSPLILITVGLFTIVIDMALLKLLDYFMLSLTIQGLGTLFFGSLILYLARLLVRPFVK